ncbi:hypothetical protein [Umezawaea sp. Da 62-37]|uniref:hypothetical protein n=1 Tax=Umezawaea sp. Da 62-37 TaxID=3075927 RepID=UPI0028F6CD10|nr:hypothetical protein [Umezawaea sp. Da 62-37]WNV86360.1 hypothetical protein RM788_51005 [Umezawaea sp. Da 62-37]
MLRGSRSTPIRTRVQSGTRAGERAASWVSSGPTGARHGRFDFAVAPVVEGVADR